MAPTRPAICVVDDDVHVRHLLEGVLDHGGYDARTYACAASYLADLPEQGPGVCVIIDYRLPGLDGLGLLEELRERGHEVPCVVVTGVTDVTLAVRAMQAGAVDVIPKPFDAGDLIQRVKRAVEGAEEAARRRGERERLRSLFLELTPREREVVDALVEGKSMKQIALEHGVSVQAVGARRREALRKLGIVGVADLVRLYLQAGLGSVGSSSTGEEDLAPVGS